MNKMKTLKSATKRFKITASGRFKRKQSNLRHILTKKTSNKKRNLRKKILSSNADKMQIRSFFPYI